MRIDMETWRSTVPERLRAAWRAIVPQRLRERIDWPASVRVLAIVTAAGMFLVYVMGTVVTNTGSGEGCGGSWPLCRGKFIPEFAVQTAIEYIHRVMTGLEGLLVVALAAGALALWRQRREIQVLAPAMLGFLLIEAVLGAVVVRYPKSPVVLALHFGSSLVTLVSVVLTAVVLYELRGGEALRDRPLPRGFALALGGLVVCTYLVGYVGAYIQHLGLGLVCPDWPLCRGAIVPSLAWPLGVVLLHRFAALLLLLGTGGLVLRVRQVRHERPDLYYGSLFALGFVLLQALAGAYVVFGQLNLFSRLIHSALVALYFVALSYLCLHALPRPAAAQVRVTQRAASIPGRARPAPSGQSAGRA
jgi:cytochrome c oxidase assembly protein subunit 15